MLLLRYSTAIICAVFIIIGAVSGDGMKKAVGETVSFHPAKLESPVTSITWKHKSSLPTVKAIEWDVDDGFSTPHPRFKNITTLDKKTGQITITNLKVEHSGTYTIDINSKEQGQTFSLEVMERVTKPEITVEKSGNPDVVYLRCAYSETIIWKNSTGQTLEGTKNHTPGEMITVKNTGNPENYYTCTLKNAVSEEISDQVTERKLFGTERVTKPEITVERSSNPDVVYLRCAYNGTIIWKNSAGQTLEGMKNHTPGEMITVRNTGNPENYYTCTLKNAVSEEISGQVTERKLFGTESNAGLIAGIIIFILLLIIIIIGLICIYLLKESVYNHVNKRYPSIESLLSCLDCCAEKRKQYNPASKGDEIKDVAVSPDQNNVAENHGSDATQIQNQ